MENVGKGMGYRICLGGMGKGGSEYIYLSEGGVVGKKGGSNIYIYIYIYLRVGCGS